MLAIGVVPRVDAHLLDMLCCDQRGLRREVHIRDERHVHVAPAQLGADVGEVLGRLEMWSRDAHDLTAGARERCDLVDDGRCVQRVRDRHRLDANRVRSTDPDLTDTHLTRGTADGTERVARVAPQRTPFGRGARSFPDESLRHQKPLVSRRAPPGRPSRFPAL
jgi:hypothetical protein